MRAHSRIEGSPCAGLQWIAWLGVGLGLLTSCQSGGRGRQADADAAPAPPLLTSADRAEARLGEAGLRFLDTRPAAEYAKGHVPGAVRVDLAAWKSKAMEEGGLTDAEFWAAEIGALGIDGGSDVVVYGTSVPDTARTWWILRYLGLEKVSILDGGWSAWIESAARPTSTATPQVRPSGFTPRFQPHRLVETEELRRRLSDPDVAVIDARSDGEFSGEVVRGSRGGHIPGAIHLEWKRLLRDDGRFKSPEEIRALFESRGIVRGKTLVPY